MTQDKARNAAVRARMAETGESYTEAVRQLADPVSAQAVLDAAARKFGIPDGALSLAMRHMREASVYPLLAPGTGDRLKVYLDLKDWVALAKARLGRPEFPHDRAVYEALLAATTSSQVLVPLSATTYQELSRITSLRQRTDLANVIAEISGFATITGRSVTRCSPRWRRGTAGRNLRRSGRSASGSSSPPATSATWSCAAGTARRPTCPRRCCARSSPPPVRSRST